MFGEALTYLPTHHAAASCIRGHLISQMLRPMEEVPRFCPTCGAPVVTTCDGCGAALAGARKKTVVPIDRVMPFCFNCGSPQPWATREERAQHLQNLLEFQELDEATQLTLIEKLALLTSPLDEADEDERFKAAGLVRRLAPRFWDAGLPIIQSVLSAETKRKLKLP